MLPSVDFTVTSYGAQQCSVIAATNPCTGTSSPTSPGANQTDAAGAFDSSYSLDALLTNPATPRQQDQNYLPALSEAGVPVAKRIFGLGYYLRPCMVEFIGCTNVLMENYHTNNTPFWRHHPNIVTRGVMADSIGPNNDGFDSNACSNVLCDTVTFNTGDDCIAIKSGKALDTEYGHVAERRQPHGRGLRQFAACRQSNQ